MTTIEKWKELITEQRRSGVSVARFCQERGVSESGFSYWRRKITAGANAGEFIRVDRGELVPVELPGGRTVKVRRDDLPVVLEALCGR
jgi:hypothetical protein